MLFKLAEIKQLAKVADKFDDLNKFRESAHIDLLIKMAAETTMRFDVPWAHRNKYVDDKIVPDNKYGRPSVSDFGVPGTTGYYQVPTSDGKWVMRPYTRPELLKHDDGYYYTKPVEGFLDEKSLYPNKDKYDIKSIPKLPKDYFPSPTYGGYSSPYPEDLMKSINETMRGLGFNKPFQPTYIPDPLPYTTYSQATGGDLSKMSPWFSSAEFHDPNYGGDVSRGYWRPTPYSRIYTDQTGYYTEDKHGNPTKTPETYSKLLNVSDILKDKNYEKDFKNYNMLSGKDSGVRPFNAYEGEISLK